MELIQSQSEVHDEDQTKISVESNLVSEQTQWSTVILAFLSALTLLFLRWSSFLHQSKWILIVELISFLTLAIIIRYVFAQASGRAKTAFGGVFVLLPALSHGVMRLFGVGEATEVLLLQICQNVALFTAVTNNNRFIRYQNTSVLFSFFLVFFATTISESMAVFAFAIPYMVLAIWWLMGRHWSRLEVHMPANVQRHFSFRSTTFVLTIVLLGLTAVLVGWQRQAVTRTFKGIMPTSGGTRYSDRFARGRVGNGDFFVAARNRATTVGPVESDLFLESTKPSLFDIIQENYDRPLLPKEKKSERSFSPDNVKMQHSHQNIIQSEQSGRTFRTLRGTPDENRKVNEERSNALFYLNGPTPIRLALKYYDQFDGMDWSVSREVEKSPRKKLASDKIGDEFWVRFHESQKPISRDKQGTAPPAHPFYEGYENHSVKIIRLSTNRILLPSSGYAWHFDKCNDESFFRVNGDGSIRFDGRDSIPELAVYHLVSRGVNYSKLLSNKVSTVRSASPFNRLPKSSAVAELAKKADEQTKGATHDWQKVMLILEYLKTHFELDDQDDASTKDGTSSMRQFLLTGKGPDFMFATMASTMLRSLGMETRLVNGFFVGQDAFDTYSGQSIVHSSNMHFWLEVRVNGSDWVTIEPSPGYPPPRSKMTIWQHVICCATSSWNWVLSHWLQLTVLMFGLTILCVHRAKIKLGMEITIWFLTGLGSTRRRVLSTIRLLKKNSDRNGRGAKSIGELVSETTMRDSSQTRTSTDLFLRAANQFLYRTEYQAGNCRELNRACVSLAFSCVSRVRDRLKSKSA